MCSSARAQRTRKRFRRRAAIGADVVAALEQAIVVNRFGAFIPAGTLYALKGDIVRRDGRAIDWDRPAKSAGQVKLRSDKLVVLPGQRSASRCSPVLRRGRPRRS